MAHGSSPNNSSRCRYAQFVKAYSRSKSFHGDMNEDVGNGREDVGKAANDSLQNNLANLTASIYNTKRLQRRSQALSRLCHIQAQTDPRILDILSTPLARVVFGLDVLDG